MSVETNISILKKGNAAIAEGNNEGLLKFCTEDTEWIFVGEKTLKGKDAVRQYMLETYVEPPIFTVSQLIADGNFVIALGEITLKNNENCLIKYSYCDVWHFRNNMIDKLKAFVIKTND